MYCYPSPAGGGTDREARRAEGGVPEGVHAGAAHRRDVPEVRGALRPGARPDRRRQQGAPRTDARHTRHPAGAGEQGTPNRRTPLVFFSIYIYIGYFFRSK